MDRYHYTECGLDNVYVLEMSVYTDHSGEETYCVKNVPGLHKVIAYSIVDRAAAMTGKELRFLRTEMGLTQAQLSKLVHCDTQTVGRWERGETPMDPTAEVIIRVLTIEKLGLDGYESIEELAQRCVPVTGVEITTIDGSDPENYKVAA